MDSTSIDTLWTATIGPTAFVTIRVNSDSRPSSLNGGNVSRPAAVSDELIQAAFDGDVERVTRLLDDGADIGGDGRGHWNALHAAIENEETECVRLLIRRGADIHHRAGGLTPLAHAVDIAIDGTWQRAGVPGGEPTDIIQVLLDGGLAVAQRYGAQKIIDLLAKGRLT
jgi:Ankyrin repeats (3 copies)